MAEKIKIGIAGWGNVARGAALAIAKSDDAELVCVWTRRPKMVRVTEELPVPLYRYGPDCPVEEVAEDPDVVLLCGGSKTDLMTMGPHFARFYRTVDSFDTHDLVEVYREKMLQQMDPDNLSIICTGWDPGLFSFMRVYMSAFLPGYKVYAFYGLKPEGGLSMGHSDALRGIPGVLDARSYTHAMDAAIKRVLAGQNPELLPREMHWRENFIVAEEGANLADIESIAKTMPHYFEPYDCEVKFISAQDMAANHTSMRHDGCVIVSGETSPGKKGIMEFRCAWDSNPEITGSIMLAYARACVYLSQSLGYTGVSTPIEIEPWLTHPSEDVAKSLI